jgi:hypothetical protein
VGIFDESERRRTKGCQARLHSRPARSSWPLSARLLVGALFVLNILLAAFLVSTEFTRPEPRAIFPTFRPGAGSTPQHNAPPYQGSGLDQGSSRNLDAPPVEAKPAALPSSRMAKRRPIKPSPKALRASKPSRPVLSAPMPRAVIYPPTEPTVQPSAPVRNPAASLSATANVPLPARALSAGIPAAGVPISAGTPAGSALQPPGIDRALTAKGIRSGTVAKVSPVGLPAMEKGVVIPKRPVVSVASQIQTQVTPRPAVNPENCGDDKVFVACPTLKIRYDTPYTSEAP